MAAAADTLPSSPSAFASAAATGPRPFAHRSIWQRAIMLAALYCIGAGFSGYFTVWTDAVSYFWLPSGLYVGALLLTERRHWGIMIIAAGLGDLAFNYVFFPNQAWPIYMILTAHTGNTLSALIGAVLVQRFVSRNIRLDTVRDLLLLFVLAGAVALPVAAIVGALLVNGWKPEVPLTSNWIAWYCSDLLGVLLVTPALLVWCTPLRRPPRVVSAESVFEGFGLAAGLITATSLSFLLHWPQQTASLYVAFPFVIWAAIRFGRRGTTLAILLAAIIAHWFTAFGFGSIGSSYLDPAQKSVEMLASIGVFTLVGLVPAVALAAQRRAELRSLESEERFQLAIQGSTAGLWDWNLRTSEVFYAPRYRELLGYHNDQDFPATFTAFRNILHPDDVLPVEQAMSAHFADSAVPYDIDYRLRTRGDDYRWFNARGIALRDATGRPYRMAGSIVDITDRKSLESELQQSRKLEVIGQLAGGVAHDFNNILAAMTLNIELLRLDQPPGTDDESLAELHRLAKRAAKLTEQLLMFARRRHIERAPIALQQSMRDIYRLLHRLLPESIKLTFKAHPEPLWVRADASMIDQVIVNLCLNSSDAMPTGGTIKIRESVAHFSPDQVHRHHAAHTGQFLCLQVTDDGEGMPTEVLNHIFEPFFTTKAPGKGTGLGLASAHGIIHQHGGWIEVDSAVGVGTEFRIFLPLIEPPVAPPDSAEAETAADPTGGETLLLVEDDAPVRRATARMLETLGYTVIEAAHATAAIDAWKRHEPHIDLLFTDTVMPGGMNGLELGRDLCARDPHLRVLLTSGYSAEIMRNEQPAEDSFTFLAKPFSRRTLATTLRQCLQR